MTDREIEKIRAELEAECEDGADHPSHESIGRLLGRR